MVAQAQTMLASQSGCAHRVERARLVQVAQPDRTRDALFGSWSENE